MKIYRAVLEAVSSYASPLHSDTVFGAFCWAYKYQYGEQALIEFLEYFTAKDPVIIFSNVYPENLLPFPMIHLPFKKADDNERKVIKLERYKQQKEMKKMEYLTIEDFNMIINGQIRRITKGDKQQKEVINYGNLVNRLSNAVGDEREEAGLYQRKDIYPESLLTVYYKIKEGWEEKCEKVLRLAFNMGIGADKSSGKGIFNIVKTEEFENFSIPSDANGFVVLSNYIPAADDPVNGYYKTMVKYGKLDREYAATEKPFKKPLLMITEGSVFYDMNVRPFYGRVVQGISNYNSRIIHNGIAFVIPMKIK